MSEHAPFFIGRNMTVCGLVASANYASGVKGQPTFLNLDEPYPRHILTVIIFGDYRQAFGEPEKIYA